MDTESSAPQLLVACLCAAWCGTCRDYEALFRQVASEFPATTRFVWVDIEDEDEVMGSVDVTDFPTLMIVHGERPVFFGPLMPHAQTLSRLVQSAASGERPALRDADHAGLADRLRAFAAAKGD